MLTCQTVLPPKLVVSQTKVYVSQSGIHILDASNGVLLRTIEAKSSFPAAVTDDAIYVSSNGKEEHAIQAYTDDGSLLWSRQTQYLCGSPVVVNGIVYVTERGGSITALSADDGTLLWRYQTGRLHITEPTVGGGIVYCAANANDDEKTHIYALRARHGSLLWQMPIQKSTLLKPALFENAIYLGTNHGLCSLSSWDGTLQLQFTFHPDIGIGIHKHFFLLSPLELMDGIVYARLQETRIERTSSSISRKVTRKVQLCALHLADRAVLWQRETEAGEQSFSTDAVTVHKGIIYTQAGKGALQAVRASDRLWQYQTGGEQISRPVLAHNVIYVGANDGCVYALQAHDGALLWRSFVSIENSITFGWARDMSVSDNPSG